MVKEDEKLSEHFRRSEFACKCGCGFDTPDPLLVEKLEEIREAFGEPITIHSGCRCSNHNKAVGGRPASRHLTGQAADITVRAVAPSQVADWIDRHWPGEFGLGRYPAFTHFDVRAHKARWGR